ncbi:MAG: hypothetical protein CMJ76_12750 [Planctomycetaceae bacterium]|nr:hypothetical protein [Planctomycetaceae bacterium]|tara:strand:+ start:377 stop:1612 length:1236 start_codon:yes stop_codon:yes gene_type:complete
MYAFRQPFTAAEFKDQEAFGYQLKAILIISQLLGYMTSKVIGIKLVSELDRKYRAVALLILIGIAECGLVLFAVVPNEIKVVALFLNGLPLGMVFGLVLSYLEGRTTTEALAAILCASFIMSSGVVKSIGRWLIKVQGIDEFLMPAITGILFLAPLLVSVWVLQKTPPPSSSDIEQRSERSAMTSNDRWTFFKAYWVGLSLLFTVYVSLTIMRSFRDHFGVEIWQGLGVNDEPSVYAVSETIVMVIVTLLNAVAILVRNNIHALRITFLAMVLSFVLLVGITVSQEQGFLSPLIFMVFSGIGLYIPYVAFHTTVFERLIAASRLKGNLVFLMYIADSIGYLGYIMLLAIRESLNLNPNKLGLFQNTLYLLAILSIICLLIAWSYFKRAFSKEQQVEEAPADKNSYLAEELS